MENVDIAIVVGFFVLTLIVGLGHGSKIKNIKEYALGGRNFSTAALVATIVASWVSGSGFFITFSEIYSKGLYDLFATMGMTVSFLIIAFFLVPRMNFFLGKTSVAEAMGDIYGERIRFIIAICGILGSVGYVGVQFKAFGNIISYFSDLSIVAAVILSGGIATLYSSYGGIKAVTFTDVLQFFAFFLAIPIVGVMIWNSFYLNDVSIFKSAVLEDKFNYKVVLDLSNSKFWEMVPLFLYFAVPKMAPSICQRISMGRDVKQIKKVFLISAFLITIVEIAMAWIPFLVYNVDNTLNKEQILTYVIENFTYTGLRGLVVVGVIAMAMSSADTDINTASVLFSNDLLKNKKYNSAQKLFVSKFFAAILGIGSIIFALSSDDLLSMILTASSFYMPVVTTPLLITIFGFRTTEGSILAGMVGGIVTVFGWKYFVLPANPIFAAMFVNLIFIITFHHIFKQNGSWAQTVLEEKASTSDSLWGSIKELIWEMISELSNKGKKINESTIIGFGFYGIIYTITTMYCSSSKSLLVNNPSITVIYQFMIFTSVALAIFPIWPSAINNKIKSKIMQVWWPSSIFYMLIFLSIFFILVSSMHILQFMIFTLNTVLAFFLLGWRIGIIMVTIGFYIGIAFYQSYIGYGYTDFEATSPQLLLMYSLAMVGTIVMLFLKPKQEYVEATEAKVDLLSAENTNLNHKVEDYGDKVALQDKEIERLGKTTQRILQNVNHELRLPVGNVMNFAEMLSEGLEHYSKEQLQELSNEVVKNSNRLSSMILNMLDLATIDVKKIDLEKRTVNLSEIVEDRAKRCFKLYRENKLIKFNLNIEPEILVKVDPNYIRQTVDNLVINAITYSNEGTIIVSLQRENSQIVFTISDNGIGIPSNELHTIFEPFKQSSKTSSKAEGRGMGLALCKAAIEAHGGMISAKSKGKGASFTFALQNTPLV